MEEWRDIFGHSNYRVSNLGNVISIYSGEWKARKKQVLPQGYEQIGLSVAKKQKMCFVHRLVAQAFIPNPENKPEVNHKNGIKTDNRVENLEWCTAKENTQHSERNGFKKHPLGELAAYSKLKTIEVLQIKQLLLRGVSYRRLGVLFNTSSSNIAWIKRGRTWAHITIPA